jgi:predicted DNA-binding transcriptional regulator YafY
MCRARTEAVLCQHGATGAAASWSRTSPRQRVPTRTSDRTSRYVSATLSMVAPQGHHGLCTARLDALTRTPSCAYIMHPDSKMFITQRSDPKLEESKRLGRVLRIVQIITAYPRQWTRGRLAEHFELSLRQIDKDLELIRHSLRYEVLRSSSGYYFASGPLLKPISLTMAEAAAVAIAAHQARDTGAVEGPIIASAMSKVEESLPAALVPYLRYDALGQPFATVSPGPQRAFTLGVIEQARVEGREIECTYATASRGGAVSVRRLHAYALFPHGSSWQLVAYDAVRQAILMFNVDRMAECQLTETTYTVPSEFDVTTYVGQTWGVLRGSDGPVERVAARFDADAANWVRHQSWHPSQAASEHADGGLTLFFECVVTNELVRWLLSFGGRVRVEAPASLRDELVKEATAVLRSAQAVRGECEVASDDRPATGQAVHRERLASKREAE